MRRDTLRASSILLSVAAVASLACSETDWNVPNDASGSPAAATKRALSAGWTPARLGAAAWYVASADDFVVAKDGSTRWSDRSGNQHDAVGASPNSAPELDRAGWFGSPTLHFDGTRQLVVKAWADAPATDKAGWSVLAVLRSGAVARDAAVAGFWDPNGGGFAWAALKGSFGLTLPELTRTHGLGDSQMYTSPYDLGTDPHVIVWRYSTKEERIDVTVDGSTTASAELAPIEALPAMPLVIGAKTLLPTGGFVGDLSELVVLERAPTDADIRDFTAYARASWPSLPAQRDADPCVAADGGPSPDTTRCDDGNPRTFADHCAAGVCTGSLAREGSPAELSPLAWYHAGASEVAITDGGVATWFDRTEHHADLTQGFYLGRPLHAEHGWDGKAPALAFTGHALLRRTRSSELSNGATLFAVLRSSDGKGAGFASFMRASGYELPELGKDPHVIVVRKSPSEVKLTVDGRTTLLAAARPPGGITQEELVVGAEQRFARTLFDGYIAELAVVRGDLADGDVARLCRYAADEWSGIRLSSD